jgi:hypothetical protein
VRPPPDQVQLERLGLFYFARPGDEVDIVPAPSPLLKRLGLLMGEEAKPQTPVKGYGMFCPSANLRMYSNSRYPRIREGQSRQCAQRQADET